MYPDYSSTKCDINQRFGVSNYKEPPKNVLLIQKQGSEGVFRFLNNSYSVDIAYCRKSGLEQALVSVPDLIIMDLNTIEKEDLSSVKFLKNNELTHHIPIVAILSAFGKDIQINCFKNGVDAVLPCAIDECVLDAQIKALLRSRDQLKAIFQRDNHLIEKMATGSSDEIFLNKAKSIVLDNISNGSFSINDFVRLMRVSRTLLYVKLKKITNQATSEFVRDIRLIEAAKLLKEGNYNVSEVAFMVGFCDPKYLSRKFKDKFGVSPSVFRKGNVLEYGFIE